MKENIQKFREYLISYMAEIDAIQLGGEYEKHYRELSRWNDFDLLQYWLIYNGVFDGGESMLMELKRLVEYSPTCNPNSVIENCNI